jgi:hypothetical protein
MASSVDRFSPAPKLVTRYVSTVAAQIMHSRTRVSACGAEAGSTEIVDRDIPKAPPDGQRSYDCGLKTA